MATEDYEILPHQLLADLKNEVEALKKKLTQPDAKADELILEMESLKDNIHELNSVFQKALEVMKEEDPARLLQSTNERLNSVMSQNETIAKGMIAISDKLEDFMQKEAGNVMLQAPPSAMASSNFAPKHVMGMPPLTGPARMAPPMEAPAMSSMMEEMDLPPPPPSGPMKKRVGLFK